MTITFGCDVPRDGFIPYPDEPDFVQSTPVAPFVEINLSNDNAFAMQRILDPAVLADHGGHWDQDKLASIHRRLMYLLNTDRKNALREVPYVDCEKNMRFYSGGRSDDYIARTLNLFLEMVTIAMQHKKDIFFG